MRSGPVAAFLRHLRKMSMTNTSAELTDEALLQRFLDRREEAAFEALLARHGAMVLSVCERVLRDPHAAEDAFQATFLVLALQAASIRKHQALASWLYGVAYR